MREGYTLAWCGWQHDVLPQPGLASFQAPEARIDGEAISGPIMCEFQPSSPTDVQLLTGAGFRPYPPFDPDEPDATLSVRDHLEAQRRVIPRDQWRFEGIHRLDTAVRLTTGFEAGKLYDLVYTARGAPVVGAGLLAVRDFVSWLRYGTSESGNPCAQLLQYAYAFGASQSAHFLRHFLYLGPNEDEEQRVFDGVLALIGSARRGEFNMRFGQPAKTLGQYVGALFPFSDAPQTDPVTGKTDGLLARLTERGRAPKVFVLDSSAEYWSRQASLIHTDLEGRRDLEVPESTRIYQIAGTQHGNGALPLTDVWQDTRVRHALNSVDRTPLVRAALVNLDRWITQGAEPPPSRYPRIDEDTAVSPISVLDFFRKLPDVHTPLHMPPLVRFDFGPSTDRGILMELPPKEGTAYASLVPAVDADGNEVSGVRLPEVAVPLATYTGWNVRHPDSGAPDEWLWRAGATLPFPCTASERQKTGDPRPSIEERYDSKDDYLRSVRLAAESLAAERFILSEDIESIVAKSGLRWDLLALPKLVPTEVGQK